MTTQAINSTLEVPDDVPPLSRQAKIVLGVEGMVSQESEQAIESAVSRLPGVKARASFTAHSMEVEFDRSQCALPEIVRRLDEMGFRVRPFVRPPPAKRQLPAAVRGLRFLLHHRELLSAIVGAIFLIVATAVHLSGGPPVVRYIAVGLAFVIAGWYTAIDTFHVLRQLKFDIDVLMFAAAFGAAYLGHYEEGALLLVLFAFGGAGEELAMERARKAISALAKLAPETATIRDEGGRERQVRVEDLAVGQRVLVRPFERVPADGDVEDGASSVDQSPITGESAPVEKTVGSRVLAGTINCEGLLIVTVSRAAADTTLAKIIRSVEEAQKTKSPTQLFTDQVEKWYVPCVLIATSLLIIVPTLAGGVWGTWFYRAMAFLTAASPCALAIGTPAAVLSGIARAARIGVLVKGGVHLENLGRIRVVAFDKTGTLTQGRPKVTDLMPLGDVTEEQLLKIAASVEASSTHPLARAIYQEARARDLGPPEAIDVQQVPAQGVQGIVAGRRISAGRIEMLDTHSRTDALLLQSIARLSDAGRSVVIVASEGVPVGVIGLADEPRSNAADALRRLKSMGIARTIMLTGDKATVAAAVAKQVGVDEHHAELLPDDKLARVQALEKQYGHLAMVGDGVNDAPALAAATVGIAMAVSGTDVAIETADVALMADDLQKLPDAIALARFSRKIIAQNLTIALGVIAVLAPLAAMGHALLGIAVLFHEGSTVVVVLNSLRLLAWKPRA